MDRKNDDEAKAQVREVVRNRDRSKKDGERRRRTSSRNPDQRGRYRKAVAQPQAAPKGASSLGK
jgi:hypothetical protein